MFAIAARRMGYRVHTLSPEFDTPTGQVSDHEVIADYDDLEAVREFALGVSVVTFEFENVPSETAAAAAEFAPVRPDGVVLHTAQNRLREKTFLAQHGFPVAPFRHVRSLEELQSALEEIGAPAVLKTAGFGYDGKGQSKISAAADCEGAWNAMGGAEAVLESFVDFQCEISVIGARGADGATALYEPFRNEHRRHILDISTSPAEIAPEVSAAAAVITRAVLEQLEVVGLLCVEFFVTRDDRLLINELAPRPHNSGHLTFDASVTSQFEQQLRAVCSLPLGSTELLRPAAMANLLGDLWGGRDPNWVAACAIPEVKLHLYGKLEARAGRKMGHLTALADSPAEARRLVLAARDALASRWG
jgi:5-(carboxyamino)imidazole ribonucleotide synthase